MSFQISVVLAILGIAVLLFITEKLRSDVIGLLVVVALGLFGLLEPGELLHGFSNRAVVTIAAMFVLSAALTRTGAVDVLGERLTEYARGSASRFLLLSLLVVTVLSAFINNTPVVVVFIPAVLTVCARMGVSPSKFLMPISFASMLGGSATLIGTSSNILVSSLSKDAGYGAIGMFEFSVLGVVIAVVGVAYLLLFSFRLLPERVTIASTVPADMAREYVTQVRIGEESHLLGKTLAQTPFGAAGLSVVELIRDDRIRRLDRETPLQVGDILLLRGDVNEILELDRQHEIHIAEHGQDGEDKVEQVEMTLFELMIAPGSPLIGETCREVGLQAEYGVSVFALQRHGRHHQRAIGNVELRMGDILLVRGSMDALAHLRHSDAFVLLEGVQSRVVERHKAPLALATIAAIVGLAAFGAFPISVLALAGVAVVLVARVLPPREAYQAIDWPILVLIGGMISLGHALDQTGAMDWLASRFLAVVGDFGPYVTLWVFYFVTAAVGLLILNKPAAALATPLAIVIALKLGVAPKPFIMAVAFAASTALATPMGYQTNLLVYGPGGYNYKDFVKFGLPLNLLIAVLACTLIPILWPF